MSFYSSNTTGLCNYADDKQQPLYASGNDKENTRIKVKLAEFGLPEPAKIWPVDSLIKNHVTRLTLTLELAFFKSNCPEVFCKKSVLKIW